MGIIQSLICGMVLCFERVVSWTCCALVIVVLLGMIILFTLYGVSLGYHYAQKQLAAFANETAAPVPGKARALTDLVEPVVRLVAVNKTEGETVTDASGLMYRTSMITQTVFLASSMTPIIVLETDRPKQEIDLTPHERELARKLIGRFRRARRNNSTNTKVASPIYNNNASKPSPHMAVIVET